MSTKLPIIAIVIVLLVFGFWWQSKGSDSSTQNIPTSSQDIVTSADNAPEGSIHNLPVPEAVAAVRTYVANELGISEGVVIIMTAFKKDWPNSCLGLAGADELCAQVITPGYEISVQAQGSLQTYRTNSDGSVLRKEQ